MRCGDGGFLSMWGAMCNHATRAETGKKRILAQIIPFHEDLRRGVFPGVFHRNMLWSVIVRNLYEVTSYVRDGPVTRRLSCKRFVPASVFAQRASSA